MFSTYKQAVLRNYLSKKNNKVLPLKLQAPTPAVVKSHLIQYLGKYYDAKKDEQILEMFFDHQDDVKAYARAVDRMDIGKFKPVIKFLKGDTPNPEDKQVHLAALLVDFERPYEFGRDYSIDQLDEDVKALEKEDSNNGDEKTETINDGQGQEEVSNVGALTGEIAGEKVREKKENTSGQALSDSKNGDKENNKRWLWPRTGIGKRITIPFLILVAICIGFIWRDAVEDAKGKQCMYWKGDRYVAIACDAKLLEDDHKIALDTFLVAHFRKITKPDTITERSIGKIWYLKHEKKFDYFTAGGTHPIHGRRLSRLSHLIYHKEIELKRMERAGQ